jgi:hypothetical protein
MGEYDIAVKSFLHAGRATLLVLTDAGMARRHNVELPEVRNRRVDLLGESSGGRMMHIELQSTNDSSMAPRIMEYRTAVYRQFRTNESTTADINSETEFARLLNQRPAVWRRFDLFRRRAAESSGCRAGARLKVRRERQLCGIESFMYIYRRMIAFVELALIFPAGLFMTALFLRAVQPLQFEPARTAARIVAWYSARMQVGLWLFLMAFPLAVLVTGCVTLVRAWNGDAELRQAARLVRSHWATVLVALATMAAGCVLAIVALHAVSD